MAEHKFHTNLNCENCVRTASVILNRMDEIEDWHVDTDNENKPLTIKGENIDNEKVINGLARVGFKAEVIG